MTKPKNDFNACDDFFEIVITGHILAAPMETFSMKSLQDTPCSESLQSPETTWMESNLERQEKLKTLSMRVVHKFIKLSFHNTSSSSEDNVHNYSMHLAT